MTTGFTEAASARRTAEPTASQHGSRRSVAPLFGVVVIAAFLAAQALGVSDEPTADASAADAVTYWSDHADKEMLISTLFAVSSAALIVFGAALRDALRELGGGVDRLASIAWAGTVIAATGIMTIVSITFTAADTARSVAPEVTQTLSALNQDFFFPMAAGFALMLIASGSAATRLQGLPRWFGWGSIVLGVTLFTPAGLIGYYATPVWVLVVSLAMYRRPAGERG